MTTSYSIAEARNQFAALVHNAEKSKKPVQITRRGQPVAVILSADEYSRLIANQRQRDFWAAFQTWKQQWAGSTFDLDPDEIWGDVRQQSQAPDQDPW